VSRSGPGGAVEVVHNDGEDGQPRASGSRLSATPSHLAYSADEPAASPPPPARGGSEDVVPDAIGRETCPICIVDFEEGDDLRLLPCEGKHRFHQECVDPWLLELSSSCPICRHDFQALETMMAGEEEDVSHGPQGMDYPPVYMLNDHGRGSPTQGRFSRYLRLARRRRNRRNRRGDNELQEHGRANDPASTHEHMNTSTITDSPSHPV